MAANEFIERIINMIKEGRLDEARPMTKDYIRFYPDDVNGWKILARIGETKEEKVAALENVLALNPEDDWARKTWSYMLEEERLRQAAYFAREGKLDEARGIVDSIVTEEIVSANAWLLKARLTKEKAEAIHALEQVLKIEPDNKKAQERLSRLTGKKFSSPKDKKDNSRSLLYIGIPVALFFGVLCLVVAIPMLSGSSILGSGETGLEEVAEAAGLTCQELIERALEISDSNCQTMGAFEVCYGNYDIYADMLPGSSSVFDSTGDIVPITSLDKLKAAALDLEQELWGVALLKVPANLPGTLPGQNVTFIIFGDTQLDPVSSDMSAFYFASGITGIKCDEVAFDGLYLEMPDGAGIAFTANGVEFVLEGDSVLSATPGEELTVTMLEGSGTVTADGKTVPVSPQVSVSVPIGEDLISLGPPVLEPKSEEEVAINCIVAGIECPSDPEMTLEAIIAFTEVAESGGGGGVPTYTPVPGTPGMPTNTSVPLPTGTSLGFIPTDTVPPGFPTSTPKPPTKTSPPGGPTNTSPPPPATNTPVPPAATDTPVPPPAACGDIRVVAGSDPGTFEITNNGASPVVIMEITLTWPVPENVKWQRVTLGGPDIGNANTTESPHTISWSIEATKREILPGIPLDLKFIFSDGPKPNGYLVVIKFNIPGCSKSATQ